MNTPYDKLATCEGKEFRQIVQHTQYSLIPDTDFQVRNRGRDSDIDDTMPGASWCIAPSRSVRAGVRDEVREYEDTDTYTVEVKLGEMRLQKGLHRLIRSLQGEPMELDLHCPTAAQRQETAPCRWDGTRQAIDNSQSHSSFHNEAPKNQVLQVPPTNGGRYPPPESFHSKSPGCTGTHCRRGPGCPEKGLPPSTPIRRIHDDGISITPRFLSWNMSDQRRRGVNRE